jgi:hypothetical protein
VVGHFDLKAMQLAWQSFGSKHLELVEQIKQLMLGS